MVKFWVQMHNRSSVSKIEESTYSDFAPLGNSEDLEAGDWAQLGTL